MKKNIILTIFVLSLSISVFSQNTFDLTISSENKIVLKDLIELNDGSFIMSGKKQDNQICRGYIVKMDSEGKITEETIIEIPDSNFVIEKIIPKNNSFFLYGFAGSRNYGFYNTYIIRKYDLNFNLIFEKKYKAKLPNSSIEKVRYYKRENSNIVLYGYVEVNHSFDLRYYFFELTENGDSIQLNQYATDSPYNVPYRLLEKKDNNGYFCYASRVTGEYNAASIILKLDKDFNIIAYNGLSQEVNRIHNTGDLRWVTDTSYLVCGTTYELKKVQDNDLGIAILDTANHEVIKFNHFGKTDTVEFFGVYNCMEYSNEEDYIYTGGFGNFDIPAGSYGHQETYYTFNKLDKDLNILVEKFYFHSTYNVLYFFKRTLDGGFIYLATSYNYLTPEKDLDIHIFKIDANGNAPVSVENPKIKVKELIIYPNPSKSKLNIRTAVQRIGGEFKMYDISGKEVFRQKIRQSRTQINTEHLPAGVYIYNYVHEGADVESGKWVKE